MRRGNNGVDGGGGGGGSGGLLLGRGIVVVVVCTCFFRGLRPRRVWIVLIGCVVVVVKGYAVVFVCVGDDLVTLSALVGNVCA